MKDSSPDIETARALVSNSTLWPHVRAFLWDFAPLIHPSHLADHRPVAAGASPRLKRMALAALGVEPCFHNFPADDASRLLLQDAETFDAIAKWLGAVSNADRLRRVTSGSAVRELKAAMPGVYPDVFAYTAYFRRFKPDAETEGPVSASSVVADGYLQLASLLAPLPAQLLLRLRLRLPADAPMPEAADSAGKPPAPLEKVLLVLKLRFPEAYALCSS
ncbi:MAG: hypothetical protein IJI35_17050 [Kiritimatiellae bacterium]|nr:hypothetical protein [Kiritimatiellia bacterium]